MAKVSQEFELVIDEFPSDDIERYVALTGAFTKGLNPESWVLLKATDRTVVPECSVHKISSTELDIARVGSIWEGQKYTGRFYNIKLKVESESFNLNLANAEMSSLDFEKIHDKYKTAKLFLPFNPKLDDGNFTYNEYQFNHSRYVSIKQGDKTVYISAAEMLTATYAPTRKDLRRRILTTESNTLLDQYLDIEKCSYDEEENVCILSPKISLSDSILVFLANLYSDARVRKVHENILSTMQVVTLNNRGKPYPTRYPEVLPYHTDKLEFTASGVWLDTTKSVFLVLRIDECYACESIKVRVIEYVRRKKPFAESGEGDSELEPIKRTVVSPKKISVRVKHGNSTGNKALKVMSDIQSHVASGVIIRETLVEYEVDDDPSDDNFKNKTIVIGPEQEEINTSSGDEYKNHPGLLTPLQLIDKSHTRLDQCTVVDSVVRGLQDLVDDPNYGLKAIRFFNNSGIHQSEVARVQLNKLIIDERNWLVRDGKPRTLVIINLIFNVQSNKHYYILEVDRFFGKENFKGTVIKMDRKLNIADLKSVLSVIAEKEGSSLVMPLKALNIFSSVEAFVHRKGELNWVSKMEGVIADKLGFTRETE